MSRLILIRHGITRWNQQKRYCGHRDVGLSPEGRQQARKLKIKLGQTRIDKIYSSDRKRAVQTAQIIFGKKIRMTRLRDLREIDFGSLEGCTHEAILTKIPVAYERWLKDPYRNRLPGVESMRFFQKRILAAMKDIAREHPDRTIAVVCHGGVIAAFINAVLQCGDFWRYIPSSTSVTTVEFCNNKFQLLGFNDRSHLEK